MPKRITFTNITPLPVSISRELGIAMLHNHDEMIELNPLVIEHHPIKAPRDAPADEFLDCVWQEMTDRISYLPGIKGKVTYRGCFHDMPWGLQTHLYAPTGLDIREKWSIGGTLPGEPPEPRELGITLPREGLYLREDGDLKVNMFLEKTVRKNLEMAHKVLVERIIKKAERIEEHLNLSERASLYGGGANGPLSPKPNAVGSHMANSTFMRNLSSGGSGSGSIRERPYSTANGPDSPQMLSPQDWNNVHPALRGQQQQQQENNRVSYTSSHLPPPYQAQSARQSSYYSAADVKIRPQENVPPPRQFAAELPGSTYHGAPAQIGDQRDPRFSMATELSGNNGYRGGGSGLPNGSPTKRQSHSQSQSDRGSVSEAASNENVPPPLGVYRYNPQDYADRPAFTERSKKRISELPTPEIQQGQWAPQAPH